MDFEEDILIQGNICKSISGKEDENGNYIFEVEASNENLDLQNQITLQSALLKSKEYFLTNGVISDDHLHKTRNPDGSVETHKDKIIGEPISIRTEGKSTFVKGILYKGVKAAKDYIELLKNNSTRVKASIGGIMPKVRKNADGSETVTSFMWNDLALTVSPVNWTVGSAKFAKSVGIVEFCKSLNTQNAESLQKEDLEEETVDLLDVSDGDFDKDDMFEKSEDAVVKECKICVETGELKNKGEIETFLTKKGLTTEKAREYALEIINNGGNTEMAKSKFKQELDAILKSISDSDKDKDDDEMETEYQEEELDFDIEDEEDDKGDEEEDKVEKGFLDATELMKSLCESSDKLKEENKLLKAELEETKKAVLEVTKSFSEFLSKPEGRSTVTSVQKSMENASKGPSKRPTVEDFDVFKNAIVKAQKNGTLSINEVQFYNSEFQKSMQGIKIEPRVWNKICNIVKTNR